VPRLIHSFLLKLILLSLILLSIPLILYWQFKREEVEQIRLLGNAVAQTNHVLAAMLRRHFENFVREPAGEMQDELDRVATRGTNVKILMRPANAGQDSFFYIAAAPALAQRYLDSERAQLIHSGIFGRLAPACSGAPSRDYRFIDPPGKEEILTAMTPVHVGGNCWVVITSQNADRLARWPLLPFWKTSMLGSAGLIYVMSSALVVWLMIHMSRNVRRFRAAARRIRLRDGEPISFRQSNTIPELTGVAEDFDALVEALIGSQRRIKLAAEEISHTLKSPLAVIAQSVEPLRRALPPSDAAAARSLQLIERAVLRLDAMVSAHRDLENAAADLVYPVRRPLDLSRLLADMLPACEAPLIARNVRLAATIEAGLVAHVDEEAIELVIENLLENAASFTPAGGKIEIGLGLEGGWACLRVRDEGPGVSPLHLPHIFERAASFRPPSSLSSSGTAAAHQGLGLWIVRRNVEALGGNVTARNRVHGGFEILVRLAVH
jgi:two-component system sensor histidine kinase ChvG